MVKGRTAQLLLNCSHISSSNTHSPIRQGASRASSRAPPCREGLLISPSQLLRGLSKDQLAVLAMAPRPSRDSSSHSFTIHLLIHSQKVITGPTPDQKFGPVDRAMDKPKQSQVSGSCGIYILLGEDKPPMKSYSVYTPG